MALILVTGATGFIGSNVSRALTRLGYEVVGSDLLGNGDKWRNVLGISFHDLITPDSLLGWLGTNASKIESIVHLGASSDTTEIDTDLILRNNIRLSLDLWNWCSQRNIRLIYASSAATYGDGSQGFHDDEACAALTRLRPLNAYGWSKQFVDLRVTSDVAAGRPLPSQWVGLKLFNVYGPGEDYKGEMRSLVTKIMPTIRSGNTVKLFKSYDSRYANGAQLRDFIYVGDVVSAICWLLAKPLISGLFNLGSGAARSWNDVVSITSACLGQTTRIDYIEMPARLRSQYQYHTLAPMEKIRAVGWTDDPMSLEEGISTYVAQINQ